MWSLATQVQHNTKFLKDSLWGKAITNNEKVAFYRNMWSDKVCVTNYTCYHCWIPKLWENINTNPKTKSSSQFCNAPIFKKVSSFSVNSSFFFCFFFSFLFFLFLFKTDVWKPCHEHYHFVCASVTLLNKAGMCGRSVHKSQAKILLSFSSVKAESTWLTEEFKF